MPTYHYHPADPNWNGDLFAGHDGERWHVYVFDDAMSGYTHLVTTDLVQWETAAPLEARVLDGARIGGLDRTPAGWRALTVGDERIREIHSADGEHWVVSAESQLGPFGHLLAHDLQATPSLKSKGWVLDCAVVRPNGPIGRLRMEGEAGESWTVQGGLEGEDVTSEAWTALVGFAKGDPVERGPEGILRPRGRAALATSAAGRQLVFVRVDRPSGGGLLATPLELRDGRVTPVAESLRRRTAHQRRTSIALNAHTRALLCPEGASPRACTARIVGGGGFLLRLGAEGPTFVYDAEFGSMNGIPILPGPVELMVTIEGELVELYANGRACWIGFVIPEYRRADLRLTVGNRPIQLEWRHEWLLTTAPR